MAQQAAITVFDGAATPVVHNFVEDGIVVLGDTSTAAWKEPLSGVPEYALPTIHFIKQKLKSGVVKETVRVSIPVMEAVSGQNAQGYTSPPKVAVVERFECVAYASPRSVEANRRLCMQMLINLLGNVSTSVVAGTTGQAPVFLQKLVQVS